MMPDHGPKVGEYGADVGFGVMTGLGVGSGAPPEPSDQQAKTLHGIGCAIARSVLTLAFGSFIKKS